MVTGVAVSQARLKRSRCMPPALELSTHAFRPVLASETLSRLSLTPLWRLAAAIALVLLSLVVFYPWSCGALVEYFTIVSHPAAVVILYAAATPVSKTDCVIILCFI
jgi:hypothetical protein